MSLLFCVIYELWVYFQCTACNKVLVWLLTGDLRPFDMKIIMYHLLVMTNLKFDVTLSNRSQIHLSGNIYCATYHHSKRVHPPLQSQRRPYKIVYTVILHPVFAIIHLHQDILKVGDRLNTMIMGWHLFLSKMIKVILKTGLS